MSVGPLTPGTTPVIPPPVVVTKTPLDKVKDRLPFGNDKKK